MPLVGPYPHEAEWGQLGNAPTSRMTRMIINKSSMEAERLSLGIVPPQLDPRQPRSYSGGFWSMTSRCAGIGGWNGTKVRPSRSNKRLYESASC